LAATEYSVAPAYDLSAEIAAAVETTDTKEEVVAVVVTPPPPLGPMYMEAQQERLDWARMTADDW
jgi:hypothetical protein